MKWVNVAPDIIEQLSETFTRSRADCPFGTFAHGLVINTTKRGSGYICIVCLKQGKATQNADGTFALGDG